MRLSPLHDATIIYDPPLPSHHEITKCTYMIESSYTCPHTCTVINTILYHLSSQQLFQCTCNEISQWVKYMPRYVLHFCFSSYVINNSVYAGFPKAIVLTTKPRNDAIRSLYIKVRLDGQNISI